MYLKSFNVTKHIMATAALKSEPSIVAYLN